MTSDTPTSAPPPIPEKLLVWSPGYTLLWGIVIGGGYLFSQTVFIIMFALMKGQRLESGDLEAMVYQGDPLGILVILSALTVIPLVLLTIKLRKGLGPKAYLSLRPATWNCCLRWTLYLIGVLVMFDLISLALGRDVQTEFMEDAVASAQFPILLILGVVVAAPFWEEFFFRGFLFTGWQHGRLGVKGTILVTALLFAMIHTQYDLYTMAQVFFVGVFFAWARVKTGTLWIPILLHMVMNLIATVQTYVLMS